MIANGSVAPIATPILTPPAVNGDDTKWTIGVASELPPGVWYPPCV